MSVNEKARPLGVALEMKGIRKVFPGTVAVDGVDFDVCAGEVHALVGENGAGKSTLMKIIAGSYNDYTGEVLINGRPVKLSSPSIAKSYGIGMIYQELSLAKPISIAENILVGQIPVKNGLIERKRMMEAAQAALARVGLEGLNPHLTVEDISQHEAQLVEIAKVLQAQPCILVMDEPTSALSREEVERLFAMIEKLKNEGLAIIYISHHLPEIFRLADRVTVMRDGKKIATKPIGEVTHEDVVQMMVGKSVTELNRTKKRARGPERLKVEGLTRWGFFHQVSFTAYQNEILGICGLSGAGRSELARVLVGLDKKDQGRILLDGKALSLANMGKALDHGLAYLSEDRKSEGLALRLSMRDNALAGLIRRHSRLGVYMQRKGFASLSQLIAELAIYPPDPERTVGNLSGGNQQKVLLAKWLACEPKVLILDEPTRGVDIGAKMIIHQAIEKIANAGHTVILISSDLPELVRLSDRIMIMRQGRFIREMQKDECTEETILLAANGAGGN